MARRKVQSVRQKLKDRLAEVTELLRSVRGGGRPPSGYDACEACDKPLDVELSTKLVTSIKFEIEAYERLLSLEEEDEARSLGAQVKSLKRKITTLEHKRHLDQERIRDLERELERVTASQAA
jgi:septal ring factor EnvC (AmiA/AmiB activator)